MGDMFPEAHVDPTEDIDRRYTTRDTMHLCMRLAEVDAWDLDAAADVESHWAPRWYCAPGSGEIESLASAGVDGLKHRWSGRVWVNPPYSDLEPWLHKAWNEMVRADGPDVVAMLLPANRTEQPFWAANIEPLRDGAAERNWKRLHTEGDLRFSALAARLTTHFLPTRVRFGHPGNRDGNRVGSPPFGCVLLVWRR
jgi:hypothetical protein